MTPLVLIGDTAIWFKHIDNGELRKRIQSLQENQSNMLETDAVIGA